MTNISFCGSVIRKKKKRKIKIKIKIKKKIYPRSRYDLPHGAVLAAAVIGLHPSLFLLYKLENDANSTLQW